MEWKLEKLTELSEHDGVLTLGKERDRIIGWKLCHSRKAFKRGQPWTKVSQYRNPHVASFRNGVANPHCIPSELSNWWGRARGRCGLSAKKCWMSVWLLRPLVSSAPCSWYILTTTTLTKMKNLFSKEENKLLATKTVYSDSS